MFSSFLCFSILVSCQLIGGDFQEAQLNRAYNGTTYADGWKLNGFRYSINRSEVVRVWLRSDNATTQFPLLAVFREEKAVMSLQVPMVLEKWSWSAGAEDEWHGEQFRHSYNTVARTLCPLATSNGSATAAFSVELSSADVRGVAFELNASVVERFDVGLGERLRAAATPSQPSYVRFDGGAADWGAVLVRVRSASSLCMMVSVQPTRCPVFDLDNNVVLEGIRQTMTLGADISVSWNRMPSFYIVFVMKPSDVECTGSESIISQHPTSGEERRKEFTIEILPIKENWTYYLAIGVTAAIVVVIYVIGLSLSCAIGTYDRRVYINRRNTIIADADERQTLVADDSSNNANYGAAGGSGADGATAAAAAADVSPDGDYDRLDDAADDKRIRRAKSKLMVADLALKPWKQRERKYRLYVWNLTTISLFYGLPVMQLVLNWRDVVAVSGNQDLCYFNFGCARPMLGLFAFNSVVSNVGYVSLGLLFLMLVAQREWRDRRTARGFDEQLAAAPQQQYGVPQHYGLFYAMGLALVMEGVMSACYHVCPTGTNFQFDTAFMYMIGALGILKIYQLRHPDVNANSHVAYIVMAFVILSGTVGVYVAGLPFYLLVSICYLVLMLVVSLEFYYKGQNYCDSTLVNRMRHDWHSASRWRICLPLYPNRLVFLLIANGVNLLFIITGLVKLPRDFPSYLLGPFVVNLLLYLLFYLGMKVAHRERLGVRPLCCFVLATVAWLSSLHFYMQKPTDWSVEPAQSRQLNRDCILMDFYDAHDIWHFLSASGLFLSYLILLNIDDDLMFTPTERISVF